MNVRTFLFGLALAVLPPMAGGQAQPPGTKPQAAPPATRPASPPPADARTPLPPLPPLPASAETKRVGNPWDCLLEPHVVVSVGAPVDGVIEAVMADRGDSVRRGQVVAKLQSGVEAAALEVTRARIEFGRRKVERNEELHKKQLISSHERDEMETELRLHEREFQKETENLKLRTILSPIDGVVIERKLSRGDIIRADRSVVLRLAQINPLHVEVVAPADLFGSVKVGMTGTVTLAPLLPGSYKARVVVVDRLVDAASGTFGVRLELPNPGNQIPAGIKCSVKFGS